jgi:hypothetical protein
MPAAEAADAKTLRCDQICTEDASQMASFSKVKHWKPQEDKKSDSSGDFWNL